MKPAPFAFHAPVEFEECLTLLSEFHDDAALLAGGQSLVPMMRFRLAQPGHVISIQNLKSLSAIRHTDRALFIGAGVTYRQTERSTEVASACPALQKAIQLIATPLVRSRGTLGGNLCNADPASELPAVALVMDAKFHLRSTRGSRVVAAADFFSGPYMTARESDEILTEVEFPIRPISERFAIKEYSRLPGGFPMSGVAIALTRGQSTELGSVAIASFGVQSVQMRVPSAEAVLASRGYTADAISAAEEALAGGLKTHGDQFCSVDYRKSLTRTLFRRAVREACE
jgi:carbon-monoxide dehydrogenase medium subunit